MSKKNKSSIPDQSGNKVNDCANDGNQSQQPMAKHPGGRPSIYTQELADEICRLLSSGLSLRKISLIEGMPEPMTVRRWTRENEEFCAQYAHAREEQAEAYAEMLLDEAYNAQDAQLGRLRVDALKWTASKLLPKKFGDRIEHDIKQRTEVSYSFSVPDRETIQLETGAIPPQALPNIITGHADDCGAKGPMCEAGIESTESDTEK